MLIFIRQIFYIGSLPRSSYVWELQKVVEFEEKEAAQRQTTADAALFFELCQDIRETMKEILYQKTQTTTDVRSYVINS